MPFIQQVIQQVIQQILRSLLTYCGVCVPGLSVVQCATAVRPTSKVLNITGGFGSLMKNREKGYSWHNLSSILRLDACRRKKQT